MRRFINILVLIIGVFLLYYVLGLNASKLILLFVVPALPESLRNSLAGGIILSVIIGPSLAALITYAVISKYTFNNKSWQDKVLPRTEVKRILIICTAFFSLLVALISLASLLQTN